MVHLLTLIYLNQQSYTLESLNCQSHNYELVNRYFSVNLSFVRVSMLPSGGRLKYVRKVNLMYLYIIGNPKTTFRPNFVTKSQTVIT